MARVSFCHGAIGLSPRPIAPAGNPPKSRGGLIDTSVVPASVNGLSSVGREGRSTMVSLLSEPPKAVVAWSSGKDSAFALHEVRRTDEFDVVGLLTTVTADYRRVAMHGVRESVLDLQAGALGLPLDKVQIPARCTNDLYAEKMAEAVARLAAGGVTRMVFGDLYLEDVRDYRIRNLAGTGIEPVFPLWGRDTRTLAHEMIASGLRATLACIDPRVLDRSLAGHDFDDALLDALPDGADPCGEKGEFHTVVTAGPMFSSPLAVRRGETVERDGFVFTDVLPA
jgi:uncharacterized protein (TIGR00290 family)